MRYIGILLRILIIFHLKKGLGDKLARSDVEKIYTGPGQGWHSYAGLLVLAPRTSFVRDNISCCKMTGGKLQNLIFKNLLSCRN